MLWDDPADHAGIAWNIIDDLSSVLRLCNKAAQLGLWAYFEMCKMRPLASARWLLMIWSEAPKSTSWSTLKRWPAGGWKDGKKVLTIFVAKLSFKDSWTWIIVWFCSFSYCTIHSLYRGDWRWFLDPTLWSYFALKLRKQSAHGGGSSVSSPTWRWTRRPNCNLCFF